MKNIVKQPQKHKISNKHDDARDSRKKEKISKAIKKLESPKKRVVNKSRELFNNYLQSSGEEDNETEESKRIYEKYVSLFNHFKTFAQDPKQFQQANSEEEDDSDEDEDEDDDDDEDEDEDDDDDFDSNDDEIVSDDDDSPIKKKEALTSKYVKQNKALMEKLKRSSRD